MWVLETDPSPLGDKKKKKKTLQSHLSSPTITAFFKDYVLVPRFAIPGLPSQPPCSFISHMFSCPSHTHTHPPPHLLLPALFFLGCASL